MLTRTEVIDVRALVTVAEITTSIRGIGAEVLLDRGTIGLERESAINCDGMHTVAQTTSRIWSDNWTTPRCSSFAQLCTTPWAVDRLS